MSQRVPEAEDGFLQDLAANLRQRNQDSTRPHQHRLTFVTNFPPLGRSGMVAFAYKPSTLGG